MSSKAATARVFLFVHLVALILYYDRDLIIIERDAVYMLYKGKEVRAYSQ